MSGDHTCRLLSRLFYAMLLAVLLAGPPGAQAGAYNFVTVDAGAQYQTFLYGINNNGVATGIANDSTTGLSTGFIFKDGVATLVSKPGAVDTEFYQINAAGQIATSYYGSDGIYHAAVYNSVNSSWTELPDVAGYQENLAGGINNHGVVAGDPFVNSNFVGGVGWTWNGSSYSPLFSAPGSDPSKLGTATYSINDAGQIVGYYQDSSGVQHGYLKTGDTFTTLDAPGADGLTSAQGINNSGYLTGYFNDASGVSNGFIWHDGQFTTLNVPFAGALGTDITGINDRGDLVGLYQDADGNYHGFEAIAVPEPATVTLMATGLLGIFILSRRGRR